jgi:multidrug transporter EmrE-like cation transporter
MGYLVISILSSTLIFVIFKSFDWLKINNLYAIIFNYLIAGSLGYLLTEEKPVVSEIVEADWLIPTIGIGFLFMALFQVMAYTAQKLGVSRVSIAVKMSVVLPVVAGIWLYGEKISWVGYIGIALALLAVYLGTKKKATSTIKKVNWVLVLLPILLFVGNGSIDVLMKYAQHFWLQPHELATFSGVLFACAFCWGILFGVYNLLVKKIKPTWRDVIGGFALGVPNFGSIYFLLEALDKSGMASAAIYPINNVAIVGLSAITGVLLYREKLSLLNIVGLFSAILAIALIAYG